MGFVLELCKALREASSPADGGKRNEAVAKALQVGSAGAGDELVSNCSMAVFEAWWPACGSRGWLLVVIQRFRRQQAVGMAWFGFLQATGVQLSTSDVMPPGSGPHCLNWLLCAG